MSSTLSGGSSSTKRRRHRALPLVVHAPVGDEGNQCPAARPSQPDIGEAAFFLERGDAALVERPLVRKQAFLPARQEHGVELEALGAVQGHQAGHVGAGLADGFHHQADMLEKAGEVLEFLHGDDQLLEVFEPAGRLGRLVVLPHLGIAGLVQDEFGQLVVRQVRGLAAPAVELRQQSGERLSRLRPELVGFDQLPCRLDQRDVSAPATACAGSAASRRPGRGAACWRCARRRGCRRAGRSRVDRRWRRGSRGVRKSAGRRRPDKGCPGSGGALRTRGSGNPARTNTARLLSVPPFCWIASISSQT